VRRDKAAAAEMAVRALGTEMQINLSQPIELAERW
jgi:hypothetical protein